MTQATVELALQDAGYKVILASNGDEGLSILTSPNAERLGLVLDVKLGDGPEDSAVARSAGSSDQTFVYVRGKDSRE